MIWLILFIISFVGGQVFSLGFSNNIRISALDVVTTIYIIWSLLSSKLRVEPIAKYLKIFGLFLGVAVLSLIFQFGKINFWQIFISSLYLWRFVAYSLLIILISKSKNLLKHGILMLWVCGIGIAFLGLVQYFIYPNLRNLSYLGWDPHQYRIFSTFLDPNFTGIILVLTLITGFYLYQLYKNRKIIIGNVIAFLALLLTYSRGSYVALIVSMIALIIIMVKVKLIWKIGLFILGGIIFSGLLYLLPKPGGEGVNLFRSISVDARIQNSQEAINYFLLSPIIGNGFDALRYVRPQTETLSHSGAGFQNSWLFILTTTGILGLLAYIWIWRQLLKNVYCSNETKSNENFSLRSKNNLLIITLLAVSVHSLFDNSLFYPYVMFWMWIMVGSLSKA